MENNSRQVNDLENGNIHDKFGSVLKIDCSIDKKSLCVL